MSHRLCGLSSQPEHSTPQQRRPGAVRVRTGRDRDATEQPKQRIDVTRTHSLVDRRVCVPSGVLYALDRYLGDSGACSYNNSQSPECAAHQLVSRVTRHHHVTTERRRMATRWSRLSLTPAPPACSLQLACVSWLPLDCTHSQLLNAMPSSTATDARTNSQTTHKTPDPFAIALFTSPICCRHGSAGRKLPPPSINRSSSSLLSGRPAFFLSPLDGLSHNLLLMLIDQH